MDLLGNIYLAVGLRPGRNLLPPGIKGTGPPTMDDPLSVNGVNAYPVIYGSIVKFGPEGGTIYHPAGYPLPVRRKGASRGPRTRPGPRRARGGTVRCNYAYGTPIEVTGAEWIHSGASVAGSWSTPKIAPGTFIVCLCESPVIDVDDFGRVFFPDAGRSRVGVLDTAGNLIRTVGRYGNADSAGPGSAVSIPAIPLCWPQAVAVGERELFIGDRLNRRVVRVRLAYAREATCPIP